MKGFRLLGLLATIYCLIVWCHLSTADNGIQDNDSEDACSIPPHLNNTTPPEADNLTIIGLLNGSFDLLVETDDKYPDVILLLGNTGTGKTTVAQILATNMSQLHYVKTDKGQYIILDEDEEIGLPSTRSKTLIPNRKVFFQNDSDVPTVLYDCPGFQDNRGTVQDFGANVFLKRVVDNIKSLKMLFLTDFNSVKLGADRNSFDEMSGFAIKFMSTPKTYAESMGLIITKTPNKDEMSSPIPDDLVLDLVVEFLYQYKEDLDRKLGETENNSDKEVIEKKLEFTNIFLTPGGSSKISIARNPDVCGRLNNSESVTHSKELMLKMLNELDYTEVANSSSFGFSLKDKTILDIKNLTLEINADIAKNISNTIENFYDWYNGLEIWKGDLPDIVDLTKNTLEKMKAIKNLIGLEETDKILISPVNITNALNESLSQIGYQIPYSFENFMARQNIFLTFFDEATGEVQIRDTRAWLAPITKFADTIENTRDWLEFCDRVQKYTITYEFHNKLKQNCDSSNFSNWFDYVENCNITSVGEHIRSLYNVIPENAATLLDKTLAYVLTTTTVTEINENITQVVGNFVLTSEIDMSKVKTRRLEILSAQTVFINTNLSFAIPQRSISILSPHWFIHEGQHINLNGENGAAISPEKAGTGSSGANRVGGTGVNGLPGNSGFPGGSFFGVGLSVVGDGDGEYLNISANGGNGSNGQMGGTGGKGSNGAEPSKDDCHWVKERCGCSPYGVCVYCKSGYFDGHDGFNGGNGGIGGKGSMGAENGTISLFFLNDRLHSKISVESNNGSMGNVGIGGSGGIGGNPGDGLACKWQNSGKCNHRTPTAPKGKDGWPGNNGSEIVHSAAPEYPIVEWRTVLDFFVNFQNHSSSETIKFISFMQTDSDFQKRFNLKEFLEEMIYLESLPHSGYNLSIMYTILQNRIDQFSAANYDLEPVNRKVVTLIQSTIYSKLTSMTYPRKGVIVSISEYIGSIIKTIEKLQESNAMNTINEERQQILKEIRDKILHTKHLLGDIVVPSLCEADDELADSLESVEEQFAELVNKTQETLWDLENQLKNAWRHLGLNQLSRAFGMIAGPLKKIFSTETSGTTSAIVPIDGLVDLIGEKGALGLYNQFSSDKDKISKLKTLVVECRKYLADVIRRKEEIEEIFVPMVDSLKEMIEGVLGEFEGSDPDLSQLDITRWELKSKIDQVEYNLQKISEGIDNSEFLFALGNIQHVLTLFLDLHARIEDYRNSGSFYNYIANIESANLTYFNIGDETIQRYVLDLDKKVLENHITRKVELARNAFLQWVFPFAKVYRDHYQNLFNSSNSQVGDDIKNIMELEEVLQEYKAMTVPELDTHLKLTNFSSGFVSSEPFYVWTDESKIKDLLSGEEVEFHSNIRNSPKGYEAVKFREIEIKLRITQNNSSDDTDLEAQLFEETKKFRVSMTHSGVSNFRFGDKYFSMVGEAQTLLYNFELDSNGEHLEENVIVKKFRCGDFMLSPYTLWTIQLHPAKKDITDPTYFDDLQMFSNFVSVELTGKGIFVQNDDTLTLDVEKYYEQDSMV